jgi:translation initiation factor IF-2
MRVYALAKQLGMENRDLIPELKRMGITVASHSSVLDDDVVQKVLVPSSRRRAGKWKPMLLAEVNGGRAAWYPK